MKIIFIHGRDQHEKTADELTAEWTTALEDGFSIAGLKPVNTRPIVTLPYYGDVLQKYAYGSDTTGNIVERSVDHENIDPEPSVR